MANIVCKRQKLVVYHVQEKLSVPFNKLPCVVSIYCIGCSSLHSCCGLGDNGRAAAVLARACAIAATVTIHQRLHGHLLIVVGLY